MTGAAPMRGGAMTGAAPTRVGATVGAPVAVVDDLHVWFGADEVVSGVGLRLDAGACVALVGQSGSGKSVTARSLVGLAGAGARVSAGELRVCGQDLRHATPRQWRRVRGAQVGLVLQDALVSLDPLRPVGREIDDALRLHTRMGITARRLRVLEALRDAGIPDPERRAGQRAGELSGGLRQRALIAAAIALRPPLIIADEPTTALDVAVQRHVLDTLARLRDGGTAVLIISHDLAVVSAVADRVVVMHDGVAVEAGKTRDVLAAPAHEYTRRLLAAIPAGRPRGTPLVTPSAPAPRVHNGGDPGTHNGGDIHRHAEDDTDPPACRTNHPPLSTPRDRPHADNPLLSTSRSGPQADGTPHGTPRGTPHAAPRTEQPLLDVRHVSRTFGTGRDTRTAVDDVSLQVFAGRTLGLVGDSGSGKTTTARIALGLTAPDHGTVELCGRRWAPAPERDRRHRRHLIGAVYQDPFSSFDPRWSVGGILTDALTGGASRSARRHADAVSELLDAVGLSADTAGRNPRSLSGGQRQRVAIARALAPRPAVLICDEPVSSLDVLVQAQILDLLDRLQRRFGIGYLFISHDLDVVRHMSDTVAVMRDGRIVDAGAAADVLTPARHPTLSLTATAERIPDA